jgi:hypothetical protein
MISKACCAKVVDAARYAPSIKANRVIMIVPLAVPRLSALALLKFFTKDLHPLNTSSTG